MEYICVCICMYIPYWIFSIMAGWNTIAGSVRQCNTASLQGHKLKEEGTGICPVIGLESNPVPHLPRDLETSSQTHIFLKSSTTL